MKKITYLVVPVIAVSLYWFFYCFNASFKEIKPNIEYLDNNEVKHINIEDYIIGVVSCEMPALYNDDAIKAQTIASRTYAYYMLKNQNINLKDSHDQCYITNEEMKEKWGSEYEIYYNKIKNLVLSTKGIVMLKEGKLFKSFYFSTSNGYTEDSMSVFREGNIKGVASSWDKESSNYQKEVTYTKKELINFLGNFKKIEVKKRDENHHVLEVKIDERVLTGLEIRKLLNLRSTDFEIKNKDNNYTFITYGYGHGVGMSQYGANYLASKGNTYEDILKYYYQDITFKKY